MRRDSLKTRLTRPVHDKGAALIPKLVQLRMNARDFTMLKDISLAMGLNGEASATVRLLIELFAAIIGVATCPFADDPLAKATETHRMDGTCGSAGLAPPLTWAQLLVWWQSAVRAGSLEGVPQSLLPNELLELYGKYGDGRPLDVFVRDVAHAYLEANSGG